MIVERWYQLQPGGSVVFVVDASDAGAPCLAQAFNLLRQLSRLLPNFSDQRLMFMGNGHSYSLHDFEKSWPTWVRENTGRLSVLTPVYEALASSLEAIVVLAGFKVFDLPDWRDSQEFHRSTFVRLGEAALGDGVKLHPPDAHVLRPIIHQVPTSIEVGGDGLIPTYWDNPALIAQPSLRLQSERNGHDFGGHAVLAFAGRPGANVIATATFEDGRMEDLSLIEIGVPRPYQDWIELPAAEAQIVRDCIAKQEYTCPICAGSHPADQLSCGTEEPVSVLPTLAEQLVTGFVLLRVRAEGVEFRPQGASALRMGKDQVALRGASSTQVYRYQVAKGIWTLEPGAFRQFQAVPGGDTHVLFF